MDAREELPEEAIELAHKLFDAARVGESDFLMSAIDQGVPADLSDNNGNTLLMLASYNGQAAIAEKLIRAGADINRLNGRGQTPLAGAVFKKDEAVMRVLLQAGADPELGTPTASETAKMFGIDLTEIRRQDF